MQSALDNIIGTPRTAPDSAVLEKKMVIDPVCRMTLDPATAAASEVLEGVRVYFCSNVCRRNFVANPAVYAVAPGSPEIGSDHQCCVTGGHDRRRLNPFALGVAFSAGVMATAVALSFYFGVLTLASGWQFTVKQFYEWCLHRGFGDRFRYSGRPVFLFAPRRTCGRIRQSHGHLLEMMFGWKTNPHAGPFHILRFIFIGGGFIVISAGWKVLYIGMSAIRNMSASSW